MSQKGVVTACKVGTASIRVTSPEDKDSVSSYKITVPSLDKNKTVYIAHRGYSKIAPENTRAAFALAAKEDSFVGIECDIFRTKDGVFVIHHDPSLKRVFGLDQKVYECDYEDIKDLKAVGGNGFGKYPDEDVTLCTLPEYMEIVARSDKRAVIELKESYPEEISNELFDIIASYGITERVDIISFSGPALLNMEKAIDTYQERNPGRSFDKKPEFYLLNTDPDAVSETFDNKRPIQWAIDHRFNFSTIHTKAKAEDVSLLHEAGLKNGVWTVDNFELACHYIFDLKVDCLTSNTDLFK